MTTKSEPESLLVLDQHEDSDWKKLPEWIREAAKEIGYTKGLWNSDKEPKDCEKDWDELTSSQQKAANRLGYTSALWDDDCHDRNDVSMTKAKKGTSRAKPRTVVLRLEEVHKHIKWTIYCIQVYTETKDYQFRVNDNMGLSMYANRPMEAEEIIIQSPVGPCVDEGLFEVSQNGLMSDKRREFSERFLEWHQTYGRINRVGAQNDEINIKPEDFSNPSITSKKYRTMPRKEWPVYDLRIFEHEIVIVEFVPPPSDPSSSFPAHRRFEILHYDEGLVGGIKGEEGYDPREMKRPPTLCGIEERSLGLPGHFTNHACGASSSAFDLIDTSSSFSTESLPQQCCDLPELLSNEIAAKRRASPNFPHLMTRRAIDTGTEITTDYSRWHWSNADLTFCGPSRRTPHGYFLGGANSKRWEWDDLSPKIQRAAQILGYTKELWDSEETPPKLEKPWKKLSHQEQDAAINLTDLNAESWDVRRKAESKDGDEKSDSSSVDSLLDLDWAELSEEERKAATIIGHTEKTWNEGRNHEDVVGDDLYFYNIRPEFRDAMAVLGKTEAIWEADDFDEDPWFLCLCGDADCHSSKEKGGFKGVEYFPLEEQCKLAPLCEPWVQQQLSWSFYQLEQQKERRGEDAQKRRRTGSLKAKS